MIDLTEREELILQKLIRQEKRGNQQLPYPEEDYQKDLDVLYQKVSEVDHWEGY